MSNVELDGGEDVRLSSELERDGAANDKYEKNSTPNAPAVFQTPKRITVPEPFAVGQSSRAYELVSHAKKFLKLTLF